MIARPMPKAGPFATANQDFIDRKTVKSLGSNYTRRVAVPNGATPLPLLIWGREARELIDAAKIALRDSAARGFSPVEVGVDRTDCKHGCKIMAQRNLDGTTKFFVQHYSGYGCDLGYNAQRMTRDVIVSETIGTAWIAVAPKADYVGLECSE